MAGEMPRGEVAGEILPGKWREKCREKFCGGSGGRNSEGGSEPFTGGALEVLRALGPFREGRGFQQINGDKVRFLASNLGIWQGLPGWRPWCSLRAPAHLKIKQQGQPGRRRFNYREKKVAGEILREGSEGGGLLRGEAKG